MHNMSILYLNDSVTLIKTSRVHSHVFVSNQQELICLLIDKYIYQISSSETKIYSLTNTNWLNEKHRTNRTDAGVYREWIISLPHTDTITANWISAQILQSSGLSPKQREIIKNHYTLNKHKQKTLRLESKSSKNNNKDQILELKTEEKSWVSNSSTFPSFM